MPRGILALFAILLALAFYLASCDKNPSDSSGRLEAADLLPKSGDIGDWVTSGSLRSASNYNELYEYIDGAATIYIDYGFEDFAGGDYKNPSDLLLKIDIYDQGSEDNARDLYHDSLMEPSPSRSLSGVGVEARVDESALFTYSVEFWKGRFFVRITVYEKSNDALTAATVFARNVADRIK